MRLGDLTNSGPRTERSLLLATPYMTVTKTQAIQYGCSRATRSKGLVSKRLAVLHRVS